MNVALTGMVLNEFQKINIGKQRVLFIAILKASKKTKFLNPVDHFSKIPRFLQSIQYRWNLPENDHF